MQHEITVEKRLLKADGSLLEPGYSKKLLLNYEREDIKANPIRIKEWDYYLINNDRFAFALTIADNSYMGLDSVSFMDFEKKWHHTKSYMSFMTMGKKNLPETSSYGDIISNGKCYSLKFLNDGKKRILYANLDDFMKNVKLVAMIELSEEPLESMVIATPYKEDKKAFYYNQKINCMKASGYVEFNKTRYEFSQINSCAVLDWGRGVWTYRNTWYWGSASGYVNNIPFGFNIGYGFGDSSAASENMVIFDGKAHKLDKVEFVIPLKNGKDDFLAPWKFISNDNRFEMDFVPIIDRSSYTSLGIIKSDQHQVFGKFSGHVILDNSEKIEIKDFIGFAEKVFNKW
ncbi:MAG: DUF2804 domain-containing protein [Clostridia bacterium]|jgi:hypothetical protein